MSEDTRVQMRVEIRDKPAGGAVLAKDDLVTSSATESEIGDRLRRLISDAVPAEVQSLRLRVDAETLDRKRKSKARIVRTCTRDRAAEVATQLAEDLARALQPQPDPPSPGDLLREALGAVLDLKEAGDDVAGELKQAGVFLDLMKLQTAPAPASAAAPTGAAPAGGAGLGGILGAFGVSEDDAREALADPTVQRLIKNFL